MEHTEASEAPQITQSELRDFLAKAGIDPLPAWQERFALEVLNHRRPLRTVLPWLRGPVGEPGDDLIPWPD